jgi:hypothetical protein
MVALRASYFAETRGFEPPKGVNPCLVSSEVPSTSSATSPYVYSTTYSLSARFNIRGRPDYLKRLVNKAMPRLQVRLILPHSPGFVDL